MELHDLITFLNRHVFMENSQTKLNDTIKSAYGFDFASRLQSCKEKNTQIYPTEPVSDKKIDQVLRNLRSALQSRNLSYGEFFKHIDVNEDGLINFSEFSTAVKEVANFSTLIIQGLFAYFDRQKIGMIDRKTFMRVIKKSVLDDLHEGHVDNFDWEIEVIQKIKDWYKNLDMTSEDAFRIIDTDYDLEINKADLHHFQKNTLKLPIEELYSSRIDRLFNLMDHYRRGKIGYDDFKNILAEGFEPCDNMMVTGGKNLEKPLFDWKLKARQQIGYYIARNYDNRNQNFDDVSCKQTTIKYDNFKAWIENNRVLDGFNLTEKLMQELFADFDLHKKGYLTENDWNNAFGGYDNDEQLLAELKDFIQNNFASAQDAFEYFIKHGVSQTTIDFEVFCRAVHALLPGRFKQGNLQTAWNKLVPNIIPFKNSIV